MIERYTRPEMGALWSQEHKIALWLRVEVAVAEAWAAYGEIPEDALPEIRRARVDLARMAAIERETEHDVIAFLRALAESIGPESRFVHLGLTSSDVVDTALSLQLVAAIDLLLRDVDALEQVLTHLALQHRETVTTSPPPLASRSPCGSMRRGGRDGGCNSPARSWPWGSWPAR
jgi:adenylosuccinate lyase